MQTTVTREIMKSFTVSYTFIYFTSTVQNITYKVQWFYYFNYICIKYRYRLVVFTLPSHRYARVYNRLRHTCAQLCFDLRRYFRMDSEKLIVEASKLIIAQRGATDPERPDLLVLGNPEVYGPGPDRINLHSVYRDVVGDKPIDKAVLRDEINMHIFLEGCHPGRAHFPSVKPRDQQCIRGVPVIDLVSAQSMYEDGWSLPAGDTWASWCFNRGIGYEILEHIQIKEVIVGQTTPEEIKEIGRWAYARYRDNEQELPHGMLPFLVKEMRISSHDVLRFTSPNHKEDEIKLQSRLKSQDKAHELPDGTTLANFWLNIPGMIVFGDGRTWAVSISLDIREERGVTILRKAEIPEELIQVLEDLPAIIGFEIKDDVLLVESMFRKLGAREFKLPPFVEMETLLVIAGVATQPLSILNVAHIFLGVALNRLCNKGDGKWYSSLGWLPRSLRVLVLGDLKVVYLVSRLLNIAMREEVLPEVEIACRMMQAGPDEVLQWWSRFLIRVTSWVFVQDSPLEGDASRGSLLDSLRAMDNEGNLLDSPPFRVLVMRVMLQGGTSIRAGGARYLHVERERFLMTYQVVSRFPVVGYEDMTATRLTESLVMYARFNQPDVWALQSRLGVPDTSVQKKLVFHPHLKSPAIQLDVSSLNLDTLMGVFSKARRSLKDGVLEWARLNPDLINGFMKAYIHDKRIRKKLNPIYEQLRMIHFRMRGEQPMIVDCCEDYVAKKQEEHVRRAEQDVEEIEQKIEVLSVQRQEAVDRVSSLIMRQKKGMEVNRVDLDSEHAPLAAVEQEIRGELESSRGSDGVWRRGVSPSRRAANQTGVPVPDLPRREDVGGGGESPWFDRNESSAQGRPVMNSNKRSRSPSLSGVDDAEEEEIRVVRYVDSD